MEVSIYDYMDRIYLNKTALIGSRTRKPLTGRAAAKTREQIKKDQIIINLLQKKEIGTITETEKNRLCNLVNWNKDVDTHVITAKEITEQWEKPVR